VTAHTPPVDPSDVRGGALVGGFLLLFAMLYAPDPASALERATASPGATLYFLALPALGVGAGIYAYADAPYAGGPAFLMGSYLGVVGIAFAFGTLVATGTSTLLLLGGVALVGCALIGIVATLLGFVESVGVGVPRRSTE